MPSKSLPPAKVLRSLVPAPEPGIVRLVAGRFLAAILVPFDLRRGAQDAGVGAASVERPRGHERADVDPHAVVDVRVPADRLLVQRLPAHEDVVGRLALEDLDELGLQMLGMGEARVCAFDAGLLVGALAVDPVAEIGVDQLLQRPPAFAVRRGEAVVVDERVEAVAPPVPDVPDEGTLMEQLAMLLEEAVAQPVVERLAGVAGLGE